MYDKDEPTNEELGITPYPWGVTVVIWLVILAVSCGLLSGIGAMLWSVVR